MVARLRSASFAVGLFVDMPSVVNRRASLAVAGRLRTQTPARYVCVCVPAVTIDVAVGTWRQQAAWRRQERPEQQQSWRRSSSRRLPLVAGRGVASAGCRR